MLGSIRQSKLLFVFIFIVHYFTDETYVLTLRKCLFSFLISSSFGVAFFLLPGALSFLITSLSGWGGGDSVYISLNM
jgi:hypothetical protein